MKQKMLLFVLLFVILGLVIIFSLALGKYPISIAEIWNYILHSLSFGGSETPSLAARAWNSGLHFLMTAQLAPEQLDTIHTVIASIRLPRILAAVVIGASLAVAGTSFQAMFVNPLVSPGLLGVLAGASFGASLGILIGKSWLYVQIATFICGFAAVFIAIGIARMYSRTNVIILLVLGGVISSALFTSLLSIIKYVADPYSQLPAITQWLMGSLTFIDNKIILMYGIPQIVGIIIIIGFSGYLNILSMGDDEAKALGVNVKRIRMIMILLASLISSLTVVMAGMVGWVGLVIPHITRMLVGPNNKILIPCSALIGAIFLIIVDDVSRLLFTVEIPIGITTSLVGIPFFIIILRKARKGWS